MWKIHDPQYQVDDRQTHGEGERARDDGLLCPTEQVHVCMCVSNLYVTEQSLMMLSSLLLHLFICFFSGAERVLPDILIRFLGSGSTWPSSREAFTT